jgi:hypothetical protein
MAAAVDGGDIPVSEENPINFDVGQIPRANVPGKMKIFVGQILRVVVWFLRWR